MTDATSDQASVTGPPSLDALRRSIEQLESEKASFIEADIQQLRELAVLNRMADLLAKRRSFEQILHDTVNETARITGSFLVWLIEPNASGGAGPIHGLPGETTETASLPLEARDLHARIMAEKTTHALNMPHYDPTQGQGQFVGMPAFTANYLIGTLVFHSFEPDRLDDGHRIRLLQSMLRQVAIACENARLVEVVYRMTVEVVIAMALAIESRDPYTGGHVQRVTAYSLLLGQKLGFDEHDLSRIRLGGLLHDIGKVGVPDVILRKARELNDDEFDVIKTHASIGDNIVGQIPQLAGVRNIVRHHHERYDGAGYPDGLSGEDIPALARVAAIADTFDAMTTDRPYREGMAFSDVIREIHRCRGSQFDPRMADCFGRLRAEELQEAATELRIWCKAGNDARTVDLVQMLDLRLLRMAA